MTVVSNTTMGGGLMTWDQRINRRYFNLLIANVAKKRIKYSREDIKRMPLISQLYEASEAWNLLSAGQKSDWEEAGNECGLNAYNLFIQDKVYRILNSIAGNATPSVAHQYKVGHLYLPNASGHFLLREVGTNLFTFPAALHIHKKTVLTDENPANGYLKVRFTYSYDEGAGTLNEAKELNLNLNEDWTSLNTNLTLHTGQTGYWTLEIEGNYLHGDFWFDNLYINATDGYVNVEENCEKCAKDFFFLIQPTNSIIESIYPVD